MSGGWQVKEYGAVAWWFPRARNGPDCRPPIFSRTQECFPGVVAN